MTPISLFALACAFYLGLPSADARQPNVVLVITDDQGYGDLSAHGNPILKTPNIDRFAETAVSLTDFHVSPTCSPTRAALLTGRYANRTGVWHTIEGRSLLPETETTVAKILGGAGYATGMIGKWHLGDSAPFRPMDHGFSYVFAHGGGGVGQTPDYWGNDYTGDTYFRQGKLEAQKGYCTDVWFADAQRYITDSAKSDKPFFCYLSTNAPHSPFIVPEKYIARFRGNPDVPNAEFYGMIENIDENFGRLLEQIDVLGIADDTIVIFMTDNGTAAGWKNEKIGWNAGMRGTKGSAYEGGHRVPFIIRYPAGGIGGGREAGGLTAHIDVLPTLLELTQTALPASVKLDGISLVPLLKGEGGAPAERVIVTDSQRVKDPIKWRKSATMRGDWRLIDGEKLYDLGADPHQDKDVSGTYPEVLAELRKAYEVWWTDLEPGFASLPHATVSSAGAHFTCHDWQLEEGSKCPWHQDRIAEEALLSDGRWAINVTEPGRYEITLRRWPKESGKRAHALPFEVERLTVSAGETTVSAEPGKTVFIDLAAGKQWLRAGFDGKNGERCGAFFVELTAVR